MIFIVFEENEVFWCREAPRRLALLFACSEGSTCHPVTLSSLCLSAIYQCAILWRLRRRMGFSPLPCRSERRLQPAQPSASAWLKTRKRTSFFMILLLGFGSRPASCSSRCTRILIRRSRI